MARGMTASPLTLYNSLSRSLERFEPLDPARGARVYSCGPTVYNYAHLGNLRAYVFTDTLSRALTWKGYKLTHVVNITDVGHLTSDADAGDDKMEAAARAQARSIWEIAAHYTAAFKANIRDLNIREPSRWSVATDHIGEMIAFAERIAPDHCYEIESGLYFDHTTVPDYGRLAGGHDDAGENRIDPVSGKRHPQDFAIWRKSPPGEQRQMEWDSPWGRGAPGWHLECSVMSIAELGETLDIHMGGEDLIFPHHEDEIAQSEGATGKPFARYWVHVKHLLVGGRKMSKSLSNFLVLRDLLEERYEPAAIRHQLLSAHYRSELNFTLDGLDASSNAVQKLLNFETRIEDVAVAGDAPSAGLGELAQRALADFRAALDDDLNTANALAALFTLVNQGNAALDRVAAVAPKERDAVRDALASIDKVLGLLEVARMSRALDAETVAWVDRMVAERQAARKAKDFARADEIRKELSARGIVLEDSAQGTRWKVIRRVEGGGEQGVA
jgi:cysteinyl-tRNA synthetase